MIDADFSGHFDVYSILLVPVGRKGGNLGVLGICTQEERIFAPHDIEVAKLFAAQLAVGLDRSTREGEKLTQRSIMDQIGVHAQIGDLVERIGSSTSLEEAVRHVPKALAHVFKASGGGAYILHQSGEKLEQRAQIDGSGCKFPLNVRECPVVQESSLVGSAAGSEPCRLGGDSKEHLCCPIKLNQHLIGVIQVCCPHDHNDITLELLEKMATSIAPALAGVRALEYEDPGGFYDSLTGTYSRAFVEEQLGNVRELARQSNKPYSLVAFGVDNLIEVNEVHGMLTGDKLLRTFVDTVNESVGIYHILGRWGGGLFVLLLPNQEKTVAAEVARATIVAADEMFEKMGVRSTVSAGVITSLGGGDPLTVLQDCFRRLASAQERGGHMVETRDPDDELIGFGGSMLSAQGEVLPDDHAG